MISAIVLNSDSFSVQHGLNVGEIPIIKKETSPVVNPPKAEAMDLAVDNRVSYTNLPKNLAADALTRQVQMDIANVQVVSQGLTRINDSLGDFTRDVPTEAIAREIDSVVTELKVAGAITPANGKNSGDGFEINVKTEKVKIPDISSKGLGIKNAVYASAGGILITNGKVDTTVLSGSITANEDLRESIASSAAMSVSAQQANLGALQAKLSRIIKRVGSGGGTNSTVVPHLMTHVKASPDLLRAQAHTSPQSVKRLIR